MCCMWSPMSSSVLVEPRSGGFGIRGGRPSEEEARHHLEALLPELVGLQASLETRFGHPVVGESYAMSGTGTWT